MAWHLLALRYQQVHAVITKFMVYYVNHIHLQIFGKIAVVKQNQLYTCFMKDESRYDIRKHLMAIWGEIYCALLNPRHISLPVFGPVPVVASRAQMGPSRSSCNLKSLGKPVNPGRIQRLAFGLSMACKLLAPGSTSPCDVWRLGPKAVKGSEATKRRPWPT